MFTILLISAALGASCDYKTEKDCWADIKCQWYDGSVEHEEEPRCDQVDCVGAPLKGDCEHRGRCEWKDGACTPIDCLRYPAEKCPTTEGCQKFTFTDDDFTLCLPESAKPKADDTCTRHTSVYACAYRPECVWKSGECKYDGCYKQIQKESECDTTKCNVVNEGDEEYPLLYCYLKGYDRNNSFCNKIPTGAECDSILSCMTVGNKCNGDDCFEFEREKDCKAEKDCVWGGTEAMKAFYEHPVCYHKDRTFGDAALGVFPALLQSKIFQIASALLLFVLI